MFLLDPKQKTIKKILTIGKGILAADETPQTIGKHFGENGIENIVENRRAYRELLFTAPGMEQYISGVILQDETIHQSTADGKPFANLLVEKGVAVGIKVDAGVMPFSDSAIEKITQGLDGLEDRLKEYFALGARFAKWRAVLTISENSPSLLCIEANARRLASYALLCQRQGIVPIVEPEVLMDGEHAIEQTQETTRLVLETVFKIFKEEKVSLKNMLLKPNMILPSHNMIKAEPEQVAAHTLACFKTAVPAEVPGIVFLSGGQSEMEACANLQAIALHAGAYPWKMTYSYGRALQTSTISTWMGKKANWKAAQDAFIHQASLVSAAQRGAYTAEGMAITRL